MNDDMYPLNMLDANDHVIPDIVDQNIIGDRDSAVPDIIDYAELPRFPGSLDHGLDFEGNTWETLGGSEDYIKVDLSGDGKPDMFGLDLDGDGITDIAFRQLDTDGDGVADTVGIDYDQDGNFDDFQSIM